MKLITCISHLLSVLAAFSVAPVQGAPPFYDVALTTRDGGRTWLPLPVPPGTAATGFGGFRYVSGGVEAVFAADAVISPLPTTPA